MKLSQKIRHIKIGDILPNPYQIRRNFDAASLSELADSIKQNGVLSPIIVRGGVKGYELICGQRRLRAARMAGLAEIPAIIVKAGDAQCAELSMTENLQRQNLSHIEEAEGFFNLMAYHRVKKDKLQKNLSVGYARINEKVRLLSLSEKVRYKIEENKTPLNFLSEIIKLRDEDKQLEIIEEIAKGELTYQKLCERVKKELKIMLSRDKNKRQNNTNHSFEEKMPLYKNTIKKTVELLKKSGAVVTFEEKENDKYNEFVLKLHRF